MYGSAKKESEIQNQQRIISQLKRECKVDRMKVSHAASEYKSASEFELHLGYLERKHDMVLAIWPPGEKYMYIRAFRLMHYCEEKQLQDPFLLKIPASENPFRERGSRCLVL